MHNLGSRLKQERLRLRLSQRELGEAGGVKTNAQAKYETGERSPKANYLAAVHAAGVDVVYVITGKRTLVLNMTEEEARRLIDGRTVRDEVFDTGKAHEIYFKITKAPSSNTQDA